MPGHISIHTCFISLLKNKIHSASEDCPGGLTGRSAVIVGGGPAGLMAAEVLIEGGVRVDVYDAMPSVGRKFLMAGKGGGEYHACRADGSLSLSLRCER